MIEYYSVRTIRLLLSESEANNLLELSYCYLYGIYFNVVSVTKHNELDSYWLQLESLDEIYPLHD